MPSGHIMYAIIETGGKQFWVTPGEVIRVEKLEAEVGAEITLKALWAAGEPGTGASVSDAPDAGASKAKGLPTAKVTIQVVRQMRAPKIIVFKKRVKKAYQKTQGHRQDQTEIRIKDISLN